MTYYKKIIHFIGKIQAFLCALILIVMVGINALEIFQRNVIGSSFVWVQELSIILFCWLVFIGAAYIYNTSELIKMDLFYSKAKGITKLIWDIVIGIIFLTTMIVFIIYGYEFAVMQYSARTESLKLPFSLYSLPFLIGAILMTLGLVSNFHGSLKEYSEYRDNQVHSREEKLG